MPIYEYHCSKCGDFETMQKMSDKPLTQCPTCRRKVTKLISSTSFQLKGSGWYITDYARKGDGGGAKGFYTLGVLNQLEALLGGGPLCERFELIFGTSTGAIIAAFLSWGLSVAIASRQPSLRRI